MTRSQNAKRINLRWKHVRNIERKREREREREGEREGVWREAHLDNICVFEYIKIEFNIQTRAPAIGAVYTQRKCSPPIMKTRLFISKYLKKGITLLVKEE